MKTMTLLSTAALALACARPPAADAPAAAPALAGSWRAVLASPGGELPFTLEIGDEGGELSAAALTGPERVPFSSVEQRGADVVLHFAWYDSEITARLDGSGDAMTGVWRRTSPGGVDSTLPFTASINGQLLPHVQAFDDQTPVSPIRYRMSGIA